MREAGIKAGGAGERMRMPGEGCVPQHLQAGHSPEPGLLRDAGGAAAQAEGG